MRAHWRDEGYTVPNASVYPFQWLWDSCFHAIVWAELGDAERAVTELAHVFRTQSATGFVPHVDYEADPTFLSSFWGRDGSSSITQPPMYGHAVAELVRRGIDVPPAVVEKAVAGLRFLLERRSRDPATGLVTIVHPWESGADDSPRWDHWCGGPFDLGRWYDVKGALLATVTYERGGAPVANEGFGAAPVGFNALVAFNCDELAWVTGDAALADHARTLHGALADRYDADRRTWVDGGPAATTSGRVRTADAHLVGLDGEARRDPLAGDLVDPSGFGAWCGPAYVHRGEAVHDPRAYWRGAAWPQLTYLLWAATSRHHPAVAAELAACLVRGARRSGFAEYWEPDTGDPLGARPQSWAALAAVVPQESADVKR